MKLYILTINYGYYDDNDTEVYGVFDTLEQAEAHKDKYIKQIENVRSKAPKNETNPKYWEYAIVNRKYMEFCSADINQIELNKPLID